MADVGEWIATVVGVIVGIYIVAVLITTLAPTNQLFSDIIFSGGILGAIIVAAIAIIKTQS